MDPRLSQEELNEALIALENGRFLNGEQVERFEKNFAEFVGTKYAIAVNNGTSALIISLLANGILPGDEIITVSASFIATANSIMSIGAKPYFVDINLSDYNIEIDEIRKALDENGEKIKGILPVHLYGRPSDAYKIKNICTEYGLKLVEDSCQAHGASLSLKRTGSFGDASAFSFYPSKNMTVGGDGGMITTNSEEINDISKSIRNAGRAKGSAYEHERYGFTARMNTVNAAIGLAQLKELPKWLEKRRENAKYLLSKLADLNEVVLPPSDNDLIKSAWHQFVIRTKKRSELSRYLLKNGIETGIHYPIPIHMQPFYINEIKLNVKHLPSTELWAKEVLSLPIHNKLDQKDLDHISLKIHDFFR